MASQGWARSIATAILVAAGVSAAQLGIGYGLGIMAWFSPTGGDTITTDQGAWVASLAWTTWIAAIAVTAGAMVANRLSRCTLDTRGLRVVWRVVVVLAAGIGGLITVPLVALPARAAQVTTTFAPHLLAAVYAVAGVLMGLFMALGAITSRAIAANIVSTAAWLWTLAVVAVIDGVAAGRGLGFAQLAVWKFTKNGPEWHEFYIPGLLMMLAVALLIGGLAALPAARRGENRVAVSVSGAAGPLLVAGAYFMAAPTLGSAPAEQVSAYFTAPYAVIAGLAGSALVAAAIGVNAPVRSRPVGTPIVQFRPAPPSAGRSENAPAPASPTAGASAAAPRPSTAGSGSAPAGPAAEDPSGTAEASARGSAKVPAQSGKSDSEPSRVESQPGQSGSSGAKAPKQSRKR